MEDDEEQDPNAERYNVLALVGFAAAAIWGLVLLYLVVGILFSRPSWPAGLLFSYCWPIPVAGIFLNAVALERLNPEIEKGHWMAAWGLGLCLLFPIVFILVALLTPEWLRSHG